MCEKRKKNKKKKKKTKKLSQFLKSHISGMPEAISLKFGMWSAEGGGNVHSKICLVSSRQHRATEMRKLRFVSSCQYTHGVARRLLGPHDTLPCVLITIYKQILILPKNGRNDGICTLIQQNVSRVSNKTNPILMHYYIQGQEIKQTTSTQYLSITIDEHLTWNDQVIYS